MRLLRSPSAGPAASTVLSAFVAISIFSSVTHAQQVSSVPNLSTATNQPENEPDTTSSERPNPTISRTVSGSQPSRSSISITNTGSAATTRTASVAVPSITGGVSAPGGGLLTGLPKLPGGFSYPPASVPPTQNAPFMQASSLPEGTVFIAVGAFLGFLAMSVLLWRGLVAWSLHRSVKRAAMHQDMADTKALFRTPAAPTFKYSDRESTVSLSNLALVGKGGKRGRPTSSAPVPPSAQGLFFSPTAGAAGGAGGLSMAGNRGSNYLPAGYYAAGASAPGNGAGMTHIGGSRESISLTNLRPHSQGYTRARSTGPSPPDSPGSAFPPQLGHKLNNPSTSTLDLNPRTAAARAPSAYLDDLFDEAGGAPGQRPPNRF